MTLPNYHDTAQLLFVFQVLDREVQQKMMKFEELVKEVGYEALLSLTSENNFFPEDGHTIQLKIFLYTLRDTKKTQKATATQLNLNRVSTVREKVNGGGGLLWK